MISPGGVVTIRFVSAGSGVLVLLAFALREITDDNPLDSAWWAIAVGLMLFAAMYSATVWASWYFLVSHTSTSESRAAWLIGTAVLVAVGGAEALGALGAADAAGVWLVAGCPAVSLCLVVVHRVRRRE